MPLRRNFLALIGSSVFSGAALQSTGASRPLLILPPSATLPTGRPLLAAHRSRMDALLEVAAHVPQGVYLDWLEGGLQLAEQHRRTPTDLQAEQDRIEAAVVKHSGLIEAMRAGAISSGWRA
ncbi:MAG: hypothetical protein ACRYF2_17485 [Janthinobacterium lividum]